MCTIDCVRVHLQASPLFAGMDAERNSVSTTKARHVEHDPYCHLTQTYNPVAMSVSSPSPHTLCTTPPTQVRVHCNYTEFDVTFGPGSMGIMLKSCREG